MTSKQHAILVDLNTNPHPISTAAKQLKERLEVIILEIIEAAETTMIAFGLDAYGTRYRMGTFMWDRLFTSLPRILAENENWEASTKSNVLMLNTSAEGVCFNFWIPKVDSDNRVPTGAKWIKKIIKNGEWLFLNENVREIVSAGEPLLIAYDVTPQDGLGKITINQLIHDGKDFFSPTVVELYDSNAESRPIAPQETIPPAKIAKSNVTVQKGTSNEGIQLKKAIK